jgi:DNA polymerase
MRLWVDIETRSSEQIKHGAVKYSQDVACILFQYAIDDGPVRVVEWLERDEFDEAEIFQTIEEADEIWAHNAEFDATQLEACPEFPRIPLEKWRCTAALARLHGLPGGLDKLSEIFKLGSDEAKDKRGKALIQIFCKPRVDGRYNDKYTHPKEWAEFKAYGDQDIVAMRAIWRKCPKWNSTPRMWAVWHLDQRMNRRGVAVDLKLCEGAIYETSKAKKRNDDRASELTFEEVQATTQRNRLLAYCQAYGVDLPDLKAETVATRLEDESLPEHIKELLRIRQEASKASTAKYKRVVTQHVGGRLFNLLVFCGAQRTGRWAGRTIQPQNLPRPKHKQWDIDGAIAAFASRSMDLYDPAQTMGLAASALRGMFVAGKGRKLVISDYANIEGRYMAWVAGEDWKLKAFADFDAGVGPDLYKVAYGRAFNIDPAAIGDNDFRRQIGKVMELALQYYGGVGAFCAMVDTYGIDLDALADAAWPTIPPGILARAREAYARAIKRRRTYGLSERVYLVCQSLVLLWRDAHPAIVQFWKELDYAFKSAVRAEGLKFQAGRCEIDRWKNWVRIRLPSGRYLCYPGSRIDLSDNQLRFMGVSPYTKQWCRIGTYNGKLAENICQAGCADMMMDGVLAAETAGYNPVLTVHDEALTEPPDDTAHNAVHLSEVLVSASAWAVGMPIAAKGFETKRYRKG